MKYNICTLYIATVTKLCHVTNHYHLVWFYDVAEYSLNGFLRDYFEFLVDGIYPVGNICENVFSIYKPLKGLTK